LVLCGLTFRLSHQERTTPTSFPIQECSYLRSSKMIGQTFQRRESTTRQARI
jgi:hypothetical protein